MITMVTFSQGWGISFIELVTKIQYTNVIQNVAYTKKRCIMLHNAVQNTFASVQRQHISTKFRQKYDPYIMIAMYYTKVKHLTFQP